MRIDIDDPKPAAIVLDGPGEFLTGDGLRFCARHGVAIIVRDGPSRALSFVQVGLEARNGAAMIADVSPAVIQAQCAADPLIVAREEISSRTPLASVRSRRLLGKRRRPRSYRSRVSADRPMVRMDVTSSSARIMFRYAASPICENCLAPNQRQTAYVGASTNDSLRRGSVTIP